MGKDFFSKDTMISKFPEAHDTIHKSFTLITGENNENKRGFINNMLVGSCGKNPMNSKPQEQTSGSYGS